MTKGPKSLLEKQQAPDIDEVIKNCIETIWDKYDDDDSGYLDKEECFRFITESFQGLNDINDCDDPEQSKNIKHIRE